MSSLHEIRASLVACAPAGHMIYDHVPARPAAPAALIFPGQPFLEPGQTFGTVKVRYALTLLSRPGDNEVVTEQTDEAVETTLVNLLNAGFGFESVSTPYVYEANGATFLAIDIFTTTNHPL